MPTILALNSFGGGGDYLEVISKFVADGLNKKGR